MRTFIYKRTHPGDPDKNGRFGIENCMGRFRSWKYDAVIGIGGRGEEPKSHGIDRKVNWIGVGPRKKPRLGLYPLVTFDHFRLYEKRGKPFIKVSKVLANRLYSKYAPRFLIVESDDYEGIGRLLIKAKRAPKSPARPAARHPLCAGKGQRRTKKC
jgi:hypothetical protein